MSVHPLDKKNLIYHKSFKFALQIITLYKKMIKDREFTLSKQILRSGTSIGANVSEAMAAESKRDFLHKISIAAKEARETKYWLILIQTSYQQYNNLSQLLKENTSIINILSAIVRTTKSNLNKGR